jgi:hypothetical protein
MEKRNRSNNTKDVHNHNVYYQSDDEESDSGTMFDYRSPLF